MAHDHFYKVDVMVGSEGVDLATLEQRIWSVVDDASVRPLGTGVGACSADGRDEWTKSREHLLTLDPQNRATLTVIEDALFILSLDSHTLKSDVYQSSSPATQTPDLDAHIQNSCSGAGTGRNRWWDKAVSIHVESNGRAGMVGEHSPCDALIPSIVAEYVLAEGVGAATGSQRGVKGAELERLEWVLDATAKENIVKAEKTVVDLVADSDAKMLWFDEYGVEWIKKVGESFVTIFASQDQRRADLCYPQANTLPTPISRWPCNSPTTRHIMFLWPRTRRRRPEHSCTAEPTSFAR